MTRLAKGLAKAATMNPTQDTAVLSAGAPRALAELDDQALTDRANAGDLAGLAEIYRRYRPELKRHAMQIVGSVDAADDVIQDAFAKTIRALASGTKIDDARPWLHRCVRNCALNMIEKERAGTKSPLDDGLALATRGDTQREAQYRRSCQEVIGVVAGMPKRQRDAFLLYELKGFDYQETAEQMRTTVSAITQLLYRARQEIRKAVGPQIGPLAIPLLRAHLEDVERQLGAPDRTPWLSQVARGVAEWGSRTLRGFAAGAERFAPALAVPGVAFVVGASIAMAASGSLEGPGGDRAARVDSATRTGEATSSTAALQSPNLDRGVRDVVQRNRPEHRTRPAKRLWQLADRYARRWRLLPLLAALSPDMPRLHILRRILRRAVRSAGPVGPGPDRGRRSARHRRRARAGRHAAAAVVAGHVNLERSRSSASGDARRRAREGDRSSPSGSEKGGGQQTPDSGGSQVPYGSGDSGGGGGSGGDSGPQRPGSGPGGDREPGPDPPRSDGSPGPFSPPAPRTER